MMTNDLTLAPVGAAAEARRGAIPLARMLRLMISLAACFLMRTPAHADPPNFAVLPLDVLLPGDCLGEDVFISGNEYASFKQFTDSDGGLHFTYHFDFRGDAEGVGLKTGTHYKLVGAGHGSEYSDESGPRVINREIRFSLVGPGPANNMQLFETAVMKIDANGDVTVDIAYVGTDCH